VEVYPLETFKMPHVPLRKAALATVIAFVLGLTFPVLMTFQLTLLMPMVLLVNLIMPVLFVSSGMVPVCAMAIAELASTIFYLGDTVGMMILAASVFPSAAVIIGIKNRGHFFEQLRAGIVVHVIGYITAIIVAYFAFGSDMISKFIEGVRTQFASMPDEIILPAVESVNRMIASIAGGAVPPENMVTVDSYRSMVTGTMMDLMQEMYVEYIPGCLLIGAVLTGILSVLWGNWRMARKGLSTTESFIGMSGWDIPPYITGGVFFIWFAGALIVALGDYSAGATAYQTIYMLVQVAFYIQALSCFDRKLKNRYMGLRGRRIVIFLVLFGAMIIPVINIILFVWGLGSSLGGVFRNIRSNMHKNDKDNNNDDIQ